MVVDLEVLQCTAYINECIIYLKRLHGTIISSNQQPILFIFVIYKYAAAVAVSIIDALIQPSDYGSVTVM